MENAATPKTVTQKELAERLNLSRTTVSRCFTNHPKINPETRALVFELAAKMGFNYAPPRNVTSERSNKASSITVLVGKPSNAGEWYNTERDLLAGISGQLANDQMTLNIQYVDPATFDLAPRARRILPGLRNADVKGFILLYPFKESSVGNLIRKFPTVCTLDEYDSLEVDCVDVDQTRGVSRLVEHLHGLGHRQMGFVSWKYTVRTPWVERRFGAFVESLYRHYLPFREDRIINVHRENQVEPEDVCQEVIRMIREGVTAIVCAADHQAYPLMEALQKEGIRVPEDVSITGFDGEVPPEGMPQMTTIQTPFRDIGVSSVAALMRLVNFPSAPRRHILVSGRTIEGETTAPPKQ